MHLAGAVLFFLLWSQRNYPALPVAKVAQIAEDGVKETILVPAKSNASCLR